MAQKIADWLQNHKLSSHVIAVGLVGFFGLYTSDTQFAGWINSMVAHWPKLASFLTVAAGVYLRYSQSAKAKPNG